MSQGLLRIIWGIFFLWMLLLPSDSFAGEVKVVNSLSVIKPGNVISLLGSGFVDKQEQSAVVFRVEGGDGVLGLINKWTDTQIDLVVPQLEASGDVTIYVVIISEDKTDIKEANSRIFIENYVDEAVKLKRLGMETNDIVEHLYHKSVNKHLACRRVEREMKMFGCAELNQVDIEKLVHAGYDQKFIAKFEGQEQYVTVGLAAIWLSNYSDLTTAPMARIFLRPRSYFKERVSWSQSSDWGDYVLDRMDLAFGYSNPALVKDKAGQIANERNSYVLFGVSWEINRSALFNLGYAVIPGDRLWENAQFYFGFTLDSNFLKEIGMVTK